MVSDNQISKKPNTKSQILLAHTSSTLDEHFHKISTRHNGAYDAPFAFTVGIDGQVYQHYDPSHYSKIFDDTTIDKQIISIGLENVGWLTRDWKNNIFFDWKGSIYEGVVYDKPWRGRQMWAQYTDIQIQSVVTLIQELIQQYHIKPDFIANNLPLDNARVFKGILNRSNYSKYYYDLSPAADFEFIKQNI